MYNGGLGKAERLLSLGKQDAPAYFIELLLCSRQRREGGACPRPTGSSKANENKANSTELKYEWQSSCNARKKLRQNETEPHFKQGGQGRGSSGDKQFALDKLGLRECW